MRRVLVLRPEPGASATVERARQLGLDAVAIPLFEVEPVAWRAPDPAEFDGLLLTSANAVRHGGGALQELRALQVYAVGDATARAAREAGFDVASIGEGGVEGLLGAIDPALSLLHLCGEDRIFPADAPQPITAITVYRSRQIENPGEIPSDSVVLIHSPRAGRRFAGLVADRSRIAIAAISPQAAEAVGEGWESVQVADRPTDEALLALAASLCKKQQAG
jgi:uroporphyrinogen-III synthase